MLALFRILALFLSVLLATSTTALATPLSAWGSQLPWPQNASFELERTPLVDDVVHYRTELQVGPGEFDRIALHRIVRETAPFRPIKSREALFLAHGANVGLEGTFLTSLEIEEADPTLNLPVYLAQRGVDVWGLDFRWVLVPPETEDLTFMETWDLAMEVRDLKVAIGAARWIRTLTGSGFRKIDLLGFSRGGRIAYAYLNEETQIPPGLRHVDRYISLDHPFKSVDEADSAAACALVERLQSQIDSGNLAQDIRAVGLLGSLALEQPDAPSPFFTGLKNRQAALTLAALPPGGTDTFHAFAGFFEGAVPTGLRHTAEGTAFNLFASSASYLPRTSSRDLQAIACNETPSEFDDHLDEITVPVFYLGAAGGNAEAGLDTFPFLGSRLLDSQIIRFLPPGQELLDVGHADLLTMESARELVWRPILDWVTAR